MAPKVSELELATNVPSLELNVLVLEGLNVEADRGDCVDCLIKLHLVEDCGLASRVKAQHE